MRSVSSIGESQSLIKMICEKRGSGIKGAVVDLDKGELSGDRHRIETPQPSTPQAVAKVVNEIVRHFKWEGPIGCTFPAIVRHGVTMTAANVDQSWVGFNAGSLFAQATGRKIVLLNDADAAGIAEMTFGAGKGREKGIVIVLTFGTGIGSAIFLDGKLLPNTEEPGKTVGNPTDKHKPMALGPLGRVHGTRGNLNNHIGVPLTVLARQGDEDFLVVEAGADYVKTSTGFSTAGATVEDVRLMKQTVAGKAKVKASGGIRDWKTTLAMLEAGADRIGTSASLKILEEWRNA